MASAVVDLYFGQRRVRAEIPLQGFQRVSELFTHFAGEFMAGKIRTISAIADAGPGEASEVARDMLFRVRDVALIRPLDEPPLGPVAPGLARERVRVPVALEVRGWHVDGDLYLADRVPWIDFMTAAKNQFLPISRAVVRFEDAPSALECDLLLVNGAHISLIYEVP